MSDPDPSNALSWLDHPLTLALWLAFSALSILWLLRDLRVNNPQLRGLMRWVWLLTVAYSGPLGLCIYYYSGRRQIATDSPARRGWRSTAHCYSGCGAGEIVGLSIAVGLLGLGSLWVSGVTFVFAYVFGFGLTFGPLLQEGVPWRQALVDTAWSESASIFVMEAVAIGVDQWLGAKAKIHHPLFWTSMGVSLTLGLLAAYPVNLWLIRHGIKEGMHDPREMASH